MLLKVHVPGHLICVRELAELHHGESTRAGCAWTNSYGERRCVAEVGYAFYLCGPEWAVVWINLPIVRVWMPRRIVRM